MKQIQILFAMAFAALLLLSACGKETKMIIRDGQAVEDNNDNNSNNYVWTSCQPTPATFDKSEFVSGSGINAIYWYYFHVSLNNSQANASGVTSSNIYFPHVGPGGVTIYNNVANDATYEVVNMADGIVYFRVKTANVATTGCPLKFNLALSASGNYVWFSANGYLTPNVGIDDGNNNYYYIIFNNGSIAKAF